MKKTVITAEGAPAPIGPYSHAVKAGGFLFTSGQIPLDEHGEVVSGGIQEQTVQVFKNLHAVLVEAGLEFHNVVKTTVYMKDLSDFAAMNNIYGTFFRVEPPARTCVQAAALPKDVLVEIEVIALC